MSRKSENSRKYRDERERERYRRGYKGKKQNTLEEMTFAELLVQWQMANDIRIKGGTKNKYFNLINTHIIPKLGSLKVSEMTASIINPFLNDKLQCGRLDGKGGLSPSYVRSISLIISSAINYAVNEDLCYPLKNKICKPSIVKKDLTILSLEKQRLLEQCIGNTPCPTCIGIMISLYTGLRIGEICALTWNDIDFITNVIYVRHTVSRVKSQGGDTKTELILDEPKTPSSKRLIPIPSVLYPTLLDYRNMAQSFFVVSDKDSFISPRTYEFRFHRIMESCHLDNLNYHALRHTFATRCIEAGVDIKSLSEILGHADVSTTLNTYVHSSLEMKKTQLEKLTSLQI